MTRLSLILGSACMLAFCGGSSARAQNVLGAERAPASTADVQMQLEKSRHDLDALNHRVSGCGSRGDATTASLTDGQRSDDAPQPAPAPACAP